MAYDFPASPTNGQIVVFGSTSWQWNGTAWLMQSGNVGPQGPAGADGAAGATGPQGPVGPAGPVGEAPNDGQQYARQSLAWSPFTIPAPAPAVGLVDIGDTAPPAPLDKQLYWSSTTGKLFIRYRDADTVQWVQVNAFPTANFLPLTGGTLSGDLIIAKASPAIILNASAVGQYPQIAWQAATKQRWAMYTDGAAETGSNAGSNFTIVRCTDAGVGIDNPISINRATGVVTATGLAPKPTTSGIGQWYSLAAAAGNALVLPAGGTWAHFAGSSNTGTGGITIAFTAGIDAGGTLIRSGAANTYHQGVAWRIA